MRGLRDRGDPRQELDPDALVQLTSALMDGLQLQWLLDPDEVDMPALFERYVTLLRGPEATS